MDTTPGPDGESIRKGYWRLVAGDAFTLLLFAWIGRASHAEGLDVVETVETAAPFLLGWFIAAPLLGGYGSEATADVRSAVKATARSWIAGIPLGLLFRALYLRKGIPVSFAIVSMLTTLMLLSLWRAGYIVARSTMSRE